MYENHFKKELPADATKLIKGIAGCIRPRLADEVLPIGVFELFNDETDALEKRETIGDSNHEVCKLLDRQCDQYYESPQAT